MTPEEELAAIDAELNRRRGTAPVSDNPEIAAIDAELAKRGAPASVAPQEPSMMGRVMGAVRNYSPLGVVLDQASKGVQALDHAAYEVGGKVTDVTGSPAAGMAANMAVQAIPTVAGGLVGAVKGAPMVAESARGWMQSALKPTLEALRTGKAARAIETMLDEGVNVTRGGVEKLRGQIDALDTEITNASRNTTATVDKFAVGSRLKDLLDRVRMQVNPQADMKAVNNAWDDFLNHPALVGKTDIAVQDAQAMKQGTYRALGDKSYGELKGAEIEAQKQLARGLKEEIAAVEPAAAELMSKQSPLINALSVTERRVLMEANKNPMGLSLLTKNPAAWAAFMADRSSLFKSVVARMLNANQGTLPTAIGATAGAGAGAYMGRPGIPSRAAAKLIATDPEFAAKVDALRQQTEQP